MPTPLPEITPSSLRVAKQSQLQFWISKINETELKDAGRKGKLKKSGKVDTLRQRVADYYNFDLSCTAPPVTTHEASSTDSRVTEEITRRQFRFLRELGDEWRNNPSIFRLSSEETGM